MTMQHGRCHWTCALYQVVVRMLMQKRPLGLLVCHSVIFCAVRPIKIFLRVTLIHEFMDKVIWLKIAFLVCVQDTYQE